MGKVDRVKQRIKTKGKRRRFYGNQFTMKKLFEETEGEEAITDKNDNPADASILSDNANPLSSTDKAATRPSTPKKTVSDAKVQQLLTDTPKQIDPKITGNRIVDIEILSTIMSGLDCP